MQAYSKKFNDLIEDYNIRNIPIKISPPVIADYHVHDYRSRDAPTATIDGYIKNAEKVGVKEIAFTNHLIVSGSDDSTSIKLDEIEKYLEDVWRAQECTDIILKTGFEVDYIPEDERKIATLLDEYDLDYVLGSIHQINGVSIASDIPSFNKIIAGKTTTKEAFNDYYKIMKLAIESEIFDTISHPDYFRKFQPSPSEWNDYGEFVYPVIDSLKSYNVGFEINTSGFRHGIDDKFPRDEFIKLAYDSGVNTITIGSDSHICKTIGYRIIESAKLLKEMGYKKISTFKARKNHSVSLEKVLKNA